MTSPCAATYLGKPFGACWQATVGAGLPVLTTLQDMVRSGDDVHALLMAFGIAQPVYAQRFVSSRKSSGS